METVKTQGKTCAEVQGNCKGEISLVLGKDESLVAILNTIPEEDSWVLEVAEPLQMQPQTTTLDKEMDATIWVHQNLIKLSKGGNLGA